MCFEVMALEFYLEQWRLCLLDILSYIVPKFNEWRYYFKSLNHTVYVL